MVKKPEKICVLGAGNGGFAAAADMAQRGYKVTLFELPDFAEAIKEVQEKGGIDLEVLESSGLKGGFSRLELVTSDAEKAMRGQDLIMVIVPSFAQKFFAKAIAPYLEDGQTVVLCPGNFGGTIEFAQVLKENGIKKGVNIVLGEMESMMYACRKKSPSSVWLRGYKTGLKAAALPAVKTPQLMETLHYLYPTMLGASNVLATGLSNPNCIVHCPMMILNAGWIENEDKEFLFYWEGLTHAVDKVIEKLDQERMLLSQGLDLKLTTTLELAISWYAEQGVKGSDFYEAMGRSPVHKASKAPNTLKHRYLLEDIPYGLAPMEELCDLAGTPSSTIKAIINLSCIVTGQDLRAKARGLKALGLSKLSSAELMQMINVDGIV